MGNNARFVKFVASSVTSFIIDGAVFATLAYLLDVQEETIWGKLFVAVVVARAVSSNCNYYFNRLWVFKSCATIVSYVKYFCLVGIIALLSWLLTSVLVEIIGLFGPWITFVKICVAGLLFVASYIVQDRLIFYKKRR